MTTRSVGVHSRSHQIAPQLTRCRLVVSSVRASRQLSRRNLGRNYSYKECPCGCFSAMSRSVVADICCAYAPLLVYCRMILTNCGFCRLLPSRRTVLARNTNNNERQRPVYSRISTRQTICEPNIRPCSPLQRRLIVAYWPTEGCSAQQR